MKKFLNIFEKNFKFFPYSRCTPKKQKLSNFTYIFLSAGAGTGVVRVDHKKPSAGVVRVRVKNDGSLCTLILSMLFLVYVCNGRGKNLSLFQYTFARWRVFSKLDPPPCTVAPAKYISISNVYFTWTLENSWFRLGDTAIIYIWYVSLSQCIYV